MFHGSPGAAGWMNQQHRNPQVQCDRCPPPPNRVRPANQARLCQSQVQRSFLVYVDLQVLLRVSINDVSNAKFHRVKVQAASCPPAMDGINTSLSPSLIGVSTPCRSLMLFSPIKRLTNGRNSPPSLNKCGLIVGYCAVKSVSASAIFEPLMFTSLCPFVYERRGVGIRKTGI